MNGFPWLSLLIFTPLAGAVLTACLPANNPSLPRRVAQGFALLCLGITIALSFTSGTGLKFVEQHEWVPTLGAQYFLGLDGLGLVSILLTAIVSVFSLFAWQPKSGNASLYYGLFLALESGLFGAFTALNFFHWFFFWELSLIPAFFLIKLWGGTQRTPAAMQFFVYTMFGSVALLLAFLLMYLATGTFDFIKLAEMGQSGALANALKTFGVGDFAAQSLPALVFWGVFLGLAVKVPLGPLHSWLPPAYSEAPPGVSMMLTGVMSKMGVYGFLRILLPIFPDQLRQFQTLLLCLAVGTIVFSAWTAIAQTDLKRVIAYSSINHLGYCLLAVFAAVKVGGAAEHKVAALNGAVFQMFNHGITASALFCFAGWLEQRGQGLRGLNDFGGLRAAAPVFTGLMGIAVFSSLGLPGLNGFIGEFLIFKGVLALHGWAAALAAFGILLTAVFLLGMLQRIFNGPLPVKWAQFPDLTVAERWVAAPVIALMFVIGIYPQLLMGIINPMVAGWVSKLP